MAIDERLVFYEGKHVRLKALDEKDIVESGWVGWFNDESLCQTNQHHYFPNSFSSQYEFLASTNNRDKLQLGIVSRMLPEKICGVVSLSAINYIHRNAEIGGIQSVEDTRTNSAIFLEAWSIMLRHAFQQLGMVKVYGGTFHPHVASALKRAFNFEEEGVRKRQVFKNGRFYDVTLVAVFSDTINYPEFISHPGL
jgi:RimJ/RimL family protein N-acetyltransferase